MLKRIKDFAAELIILAASIALSLPINMYVISRSWYEVPTVGWFGSIITIFSIFWGLFGILCHSSLKKEFYTLAIGSIILALGISTQLPNTPLEPSFRNILIGIAFIASIFGTMGDASESTW